MRIKTVLNRVHKVKGFVYGQIRFNGDQLEVELRPRKGSRPICSGCGRPGPGYDTLPRRRFAFVPLWAIGVFLIYARRRVDCRRCGVKVERVPWADGKHRLTQAYAVFLARWARRLSWREVSLIFKTSWENVYRSVAWVVEYGLKNRSLDGITAIGVDEVQFQKGHRYLTVVYQIDQDCRRLLWIGKDRTTKTLLRFFRMMGKERTAVLQFICSDMWQPYLKVIAKKASQALHILDRFHIVAKLNQAIDEVRAAEAKELAADGYEPVLKHSRWCFLKRVANLTGKQSARLADLMCYSLFGGARVSAQGELPGVVGVLLVPLGRRLPRRLAEAGHAESAGSDQEGGPQHPSSSGPDPELVRSQEGVFERDRGGVELRHQTDHQKGVRLPNARSRRNRPLSRPRPPTRAGTHPRILLRRLPPDQLVVSRISA